MLISTIFVLMLFYYSRSRLIRGRRIQIPCRFLNSPTIYHTTSTDQPASLTIFFAFGIYTYTWQEWGLDEGIFLQISSSVSRIGLSWTGYRASGFRTVLAISATGFCLFDIAIMFCSSFPIFSVRIWFSGNIPFSSNKLSVSVLITAIFMMKSWRICCNVQTSNRGQISYDYIWFDICCTNILVFEESCQCYYKF